jgi:hypothetical protein
VSGLVLGQTVGRVERVTDIVKFDQVAVDSFWEYLDVSSELKSLEKIRSNQESHWLNDSVIGM